MGLGDPEVLCTFEVNRSGTWTEKGDDLAAAEMTPFSVIADDDLR